VTAVCARAGVHARSAQPRTARALELQILCATRGSAVARCCAYVIALNAPAIMAALARNLGREVDDNDDNGEPRPRRLAPRGMDGPSDAQKK
jgi:hypothetical protein